VLNLAKILEKKSKKRKNIKVKLTRTDDNFIPLDERAVIANGMEGDLFISLHANACLDRCAGGIEIYHLDNQQNKYTDKLARVENQITKNNSSLNTILVGMTMSFYIKDSIMFAESIGKKMEPTLGKYGIKLRDYKKGALFYVLVGARMPSILLEIGFISNPEERRLMQNRDYLESLADTILDGIEKTKNNPYLVRNGNNKTD